jgi:CheY-like chemotaxis protein
MEAVAWQLARLHRPDAPPARKLSVVIAEDNPSNAQVIRSLVERAVPNAEIRVAADGRLALDLVLRDRPHLLIVDLRLPKLSGLDVCLNVRRTPVAEQPTILPVSAHADRNEIELLRDLGLRFLPKGLELTERLPGLVRDLARRARQRGAGLAK